MPDVHSDMSAADLRALAEQLTREADAREAAIPADREALARMRTEGRHAEIADMRARGELRHLLGPTE